MKTARLAVASVALTLAFNFTVFAGTWRQGESHSGTWRYNYDDEQCPSDIWVWLDGNKDGAMEYYYSGKNGWLLTDTATPDGHQVNAGGQWATYGQTHCAYSTATTREAARTVSNKTCRPREAVHSYGRDGSPDEDTGKHINGPKSPLTRRIF